MSSQIKIYSKRTSSRSSIKSPRNQNDNSPHRINIDHDKSKGPQTQFSSQVQSSPKISLRSSMNKNSRHERITQDR